MKKSAHTRSFFSLATSFVHKKIVEKKEVYKGRMLVCHVFRLTIVFM